MKKKQEFKHIDKKCYFCPEENYSLLDVHRIIPGSEGGKYTRHNTVTCCSKCHRKIHAGLIKIIGRYFSTKGYVLHYINEQGKEMIH